MRVWTVDALLLFGSMIALGLFNCRRDHGVLRTVVVSRRSLDLKSRCKRAVLQGRESRQTFFVFLAKKKKKNENIEQDYRISRVLKG